MRMGIKVDVKQALRIQKMVWEMMTLYNTFEKIWAAEQKKSCCVILIPFEDWWYQ